MKEERNCLHLMINNLRSKKKMVLFVGILFIMNIIIQVITPRVLSYFIDSVETGKTFNYLSLVIGAYIMAIIFKMIIGVCESYFSQKLGWEITNIFKKDVLKHFLKIDMKHHKKWTSGEVITRLENDTEGLYTYFYVLIFKLTGSVLLMVLVLAVLARKSIIISAGMTIYCIIGVWIFKAIQDYGTKLYNTRVKAISKFNGFMKENIDNAVEVRTNGAVEYSIYSLNEAMKKRFKKSFPAGMMYSKLWNASTIIEAVGTITFLGIAVILWGKGSITLGTVYLVYSYSGLIYDPLQNFRNNMSSLQEARGKLKRVQEMLDMESEIKEGQKEIDKKVKSLEVKNLSFAYEKDNHILKEINFKLKAGERLGLMGETGSGKSTMVKLLARLYEFNTGEILINGINVKEINGKSLREAVSYCTQEVQFFHGNLRDNITLFDENVDDDRILRAIKEAGLQEWFGKFKDGLDTHLEMGENSLSAGEAQLISILRLFIKDASIIILDEISSRLDTLTEHRIMRAVDALSKDKIVISIAHKFSALKYADKVMILEQGRIAEYGNKKELESREDSMLGKICSGITVNKG